MANHLGMALIDTIVTLHQRGWSARRIARELGIHRETVARYLAASSLQAKPAIAPSGNSPGDQGDPVGEISGLSAPSSPSIQPGKPGRRSDCLPFVAVIDTKLQQGLSAQRIYQDLVADHGFVGSYYSVRRYVQNAQRSTALPFRRMECAAGEEAQVDFGLGAPILMGKHKKRPHVLRVILSHSRKGYSEVVSRQTTENFIRALENAWWSFGGVPQRLVLDNLRAAVSKCDWFDPEINPKVRSFAQYYGPALMPTRPYTPRHKGKVERGVDYVQENALRGRSFGSLQEQNLFLQQWEETVADCRVHGTTRQQVGKHFREVEQPLLNALPAHRFAVFEETRRIVGRDGYVELSRAYYSAPPEYVGLRVWVRHDGRVVRLFNERMDQIAVHVQQEAGRFSTQPGHIPASKINSGEGGPAGLMPRIGQVGRQAVLWAEAMLRQRGMEGVRVLQGLLALRKDHSDAAINRACDIAMSHGEYRLKTVRALVGQYRTQPSEEVSLTEEHAVIRPLTEYGRMFPLLEQEY